mmetsp:Transcript_33983/g.102488  ORF Transcript_33983/g.102488 Transcript_33983/m.102488 type:complete len:298 (+) Transcript_33983:589-1482(+)
MAFCTPSRPSSATEILPSFSAASACRSSVASSRAFLRPAMASESSAMSLVTSFCRASLLLCSPVSVSISSLAWSRASVVLAMFSSQKPFCVASASASASSLATMSLMTLRTFTKWSSRCSTAATRPAAATSAPLLKLLAEVVRNSTTSLTVAAAETSPLLPTLAPRSCRKLGAEAFRTELAGAGLATAAWPLRVCESTSFSLTLCFGATSRPELAGAGVATAAWTLRVCKSTSFSLTLYFGATSDWRIFMALEICCSSAARVLERMSQSLAFSSHSAFSRPRNAPSFSMSAFSLSAS